MKSSIANGFDFDAYTSLGQILQRRGAVTHRQLERAAKAAEKAGKRIGDMLIDMGLCTREEVIEAVEEQNKIRPAPCDESAGALQRLSLSLERAGDAADNLKKTTTQKIHILKISPDN